MTLSEFKAWLEGYSASFVDAPNAKQWEVITAKLATVGIAPQVQIPPVRPFTTPNDWQRQSGTSAGDYRSQFIYGTCGQVPEAIRNDVTSRATAATTGYMRHIYGTN